MQQSKSFSRKSIFTLAHQLIKNKTFSNLSDSLKAAWKAAKTEAIETIQFVKKSTGKLTKRVVTRNLSNYYTSKNSGNTKPKGLILFVDMAKVVSGVNHVIISAYADSLKAA